MTKFSYKFNDEGLILLISYRLYDFKYDLVHRHLLISNSWRSWWWFFLLFSCFFRCI